MELTNKAIQWENVVQRTKERSEATRAAVSQPTPAGPSPFKCMESYIILYYVNVNGYMIFIYMIHKHLDKVINGKEQEEDSMKNRFS